MMRVAVYAID